MATEITARIYFDSEPDPAHLFARLIEVVSAWGEADVPWQGLRVVSGAPRETIHRDDSLLDPGALVAAAARFSGRSQQISSRTSYRCWRFQGRKAEWGSSLAWVEAWGDDYGRIHGEDVRRVWGSATFTIADCGPYCAVIPAEDAAATAVNERVEENLDRLTKLVFRIVEALEPASLKVFTDQGAFLPFNAHLAYYASEARLLEDARLIADVWQRGLPGHQIPPLGDLADGRSIAFHWWRSDEARRRLMTALGDRIHRVAAITTEDIRRTLAGGEFDNYSMPRGFTLLEFPHFLNAFIDRFFLKLLDDKART
jgi:hypothetical protein